MADTQNAPPLPGITPKVYFDGKVQSLGFMDEYLERHTVGVVLPGEYDFGEAETIEEITVTFGVMTVNGHRFIVGETVTLTPGDKIVISVADPAAYRCDYR